MNDIIITLDFPPTVNSYYTKTKRGIFISPKGRAFRECVSKACNEQGVYGIQLPCRLAVDVILYPPDRRTRDLDNYMKALLDSLTIAKIWEDDELIDNLNIHRGKVLSGAGKCALRITEHHGLIMPDTEDIWDAIE